MQLNRHGLRAARALQRRAAAMRRAALRKIISRRLRRGLDVLQELTELNWLRRNKPAHNYR